MEVTSPFKAPIVDELSVRVVVDSSYERFLPKTAPPNPQRSADSIQKALSTQKALLKKWFGCVR